MSADETGVHFSNTIDDLNGVNPIQYLYAYNGGGVGVGDLDNDGLPDIVFTSNQRGVTLYKNNGDFRFDDKTNKCGFIERGGWFTGVTLVDINADGLLDIYICRSGIDSAHRTNLLYINEGDFRFKEMSSFWGLDDASPSTHAVFFDYDNDGDLDCYIVNHPVSFQNMWNFVAFSSPTYTEEGSDKLLENDNGRFVEVTNNAGISKSYSFGLSVSIGDINNDGWQDIYVCNDFASPDRLYVNNRDKTFSDVTETHLSSTSFFTMGSEIGDINNDGWQDIFTVDMMPDNHFRAKSKVFTLPLQLYEEIGKVFPVPQYVRNSLQLNDYGTRFVNISEFSGTASTDWSWGVNMADVNNDGMKDILVTNGIKRDYFDLDFVTLQDEAGARVGFKHNTDSLIQKMPTSLLQNYCFINKGNLKFSNSRADIGLTESAISNGCAIADLDGDGDLDWVVNNSDSKAFVYRNNSEKIVQNHFFRTKLVGDKFNPFAIGAKVHVYSGGNMQICQLSTVKGFQSSSEPILHFGLEKNLKVDSVLIYWKPGFVTIHRDLTGDTLYTFTYPEKSSSVSHLPTVYSSTLQVRESVVNHQEGKFNDYKQDRLIPFSLSTEGPATCVFDWNNDGLLDVFVGGARNGSASAIFFQDNLSNFSGRNIEALPNKLEVTGVAPLNFNRDNQMDIILTCGSNEKDSELPDGGVRLLMNDKSNFIDVSSVRLPNFEVGCYSSPVVLDFDNDGLPDLFIGGRLKAGRYPESPPSYLLRNTGNGFEDVSLKNFKKASSLFNCTAAVAFDYDHDGDDDLVVAFEWQPIRLFENDEGKFNEVKWSSNMDTLSGWWKSIKVLDIDGDGDLDLLLGNQGLNSYIKSSFEEPATMYYSDFDNNGVKEPLLYHYLNGEDGLLYDRNTLCEQMPAFRNKYLTYKKYAQDASQDFKDLARSLKSKIYRANFFESGWLENMEKGKFTWHSFPHKVQCSPTFDFTLADVNSDGVNELMIVGGSKSDYYSSSPSIGFTLLIYKIQPDKTLKEIPFQAKNNLINGCGRRLIQINKTEFILLRNNNKALQLGKLLN